MSDFNDKCGKVLTGGATGAAAGDAAPEAGTFRRRYDES